ncbi:MAG: hypothetical protein ABI821_02400 [Pseudomonadota bacterium]
MTQFTYNAHSFLAGIFVLAILFSTANYYFDFGFFGRGAKGVVLAVLGLFIVYGYFFSPTRDEMREQKNAGKPANTRQD